MADRATTVAETERVNPRYIVGECIEVLSTLEPASVDCVVTSPPFLGLRDYESGDERELGHETSPGAFIGALLDVVAAIEPVLKPDGSLCIELGDTYADSGGAGGDYNQGGMREGQPKWRQRKDQGDRRTVGGADRPGGHHNGGLGWPPGKSMTLVPHLFAASLAYGRNLLTGEDAPTGRWRIRNVICWGRTNPTPGAVGDKARVGTSYITIACRTRARYWDAEAMSVEGDDGDLVPVLDWMIEPGEDTWRIANGKGPASPIAAAERAHFAVWPEEVARRLIVGMCAPGGVVLDPFCGTGTTLAAAQGVGRVGIGIDLDARNAELAREKVGMFLEIDDLPIREASD